MQRYILVSAIIASYFLFPWRAFGSDDRIIKSCSQASAAAGVCLGGLAGVAFTNEMQKFNPRSCSDSACRLGIPVMIAAFSGVVAYRIGYFAGLCAVSARKCTRYMMGWENPNLQIGLTPLALADTLVANANCQICLGDALEEPKMPFVMVWNCGHAFHKKCLNSWRQLRHNKCPLCRAVIDPEGFESENDDASD